MLSVHLCFVVAPVGVEPTLQLLVESDFKSDAFCLFRHGAIYATIPTRTGTSLITITKCFQDTSLTN